MRTRGDTRKVYFDVFGNIEEFFEDRGLACAFGELCATFAGQLRNLQLRGYPYR